MTEVECIAVVCCDALCIFDIEEVFVMDNLSGYFVQANSIQLGAVKLCRCYLYLIIPYDR